MGGVNLEPVADVEILLGLGDGAARGYRREPGMPDYDIVAVALGEKAEDLCSDGLTTIVSDDQILGELATGRSSDEIVGELVDLANSLGGPDNTIVIDRRAHV